MSFKELLGSIGIHWDELDALWPADSADRFRARNDRLQHALRTRYAKLIRCRRRIEQIRQRRFSEETASKLRRLEAVHSALLEDVWKLRARLTKRLIPSHS